ncbi:MAG: transcriptional repressor [Acidobacteria bacterium]|nr:transcriptional repressor [Acidobacteriota bacterium]
MQSASEFVDKHRPAGGRRSSKRDLIVQVFLRQEGHLSAEELTDLLRQTDKRISRATVYRTLQWMVDAGIAGKVDFGGGKFRFERAYRHPRHFHFICKTCHQSFEFLSSDIEALIEEVAAAREFAARQSMLQIYGTCQWCQQGQTPPPMAPAELLFARDALRIAIATERSGREFYTRAARITRDGPGRRIFQKLAGEEVEHLRKLEQRYAELVAAEPGLESHPTFLFFKGAANGLFAAGTEELSDGIDEGKALMIGIRCERGSHAFFKKYGERFEESEGKRIFLEFADEEREHLDLLLREYRNLVARQRRTSSAPSSRLAKSRAKRPRRPA